MTDAVDWWIVPYTIDYAVMTDVGGRPMRSAGYDARKRSRPMYYVGCLIKSGRIGYLIAYPCTIAGWSDLQTTALALKTCCFVDNKYSVRVLCLLSFTEKSGVLKSTFLNKQP